MTPTRINGSNESVGNSRARQLIEEWLPFLREIESDVQVKQNHLWLGGEPLMKLGRDDFVYQTDSRRRSIATTKPGAEQAIRAILVRRHGQRLRQRAVVALESNPLARVVLESAGVYLMVGDRRLGVVGESLRHARVAGTPIRANFFTEGPHWEELAEACAIHAPLLTDAGTRRGERKTRTHALPTTTPVVLTQPPADLSADLIRDCLRASSDIRERRTSALDREATFGWRGRTLTFAPIPRFNGVRAVSFRCEDGERVVEGVLTLDGPNDPLPVAIYEETLTPTGAMAWAACLLVFRDFSVRDYAVNRSERRHRGGYSRPAESSRSWDRRVPRSSSLPGVEHPWSYPLEVERRSPDDPVWVHGHARRLAPGQDASPSKKREAADWCDLMPGWTWVRGHQRGGTADAVVRFRWRPPTTFKDNFLCEAAADESDQAR